VPTTSCPPSELHGPSLSEVLSLALIHAPARREELERVTPQIEQRLESLWDEEEKEKEGLVKLRQKLIDQWRSNT